MDSKNPDEVAQYEAEIKKIRDGVLEKGEDIKIGLSEDLIPSKDATTVIFTCPKTVSELFALMKNGKSCLDDWKCVLLI